MNKLIKYWGLLGVGIIMGGCSNDAEPYINSSNNEESFVSFNLSIDALQANESPTRSLASGYHFSDGKSISVVKCYVYNQALGTSAEPIKTFDISISNLKGEIKIPLPKNDVFDIVFLATSFQQTNSASKMFYSTTERSLNINYNLVKNNDEEIDCFYAVKKSVSANSSTNNEVELSDDKKIT